MVNGVGCCCGQVSTKAFEVARVIYTAEDNIFFSLSVVDEVGRLLPQSFSDRAEAECT